MLLIGSAVLILVGCANAQSCQSFGQTQNCRVFNLSLPKDVSTIDREINLMAINLTDDSVDACDGKLVPISTIPNAMDMLCVWYYVDQATKLLENNDRTCLTAGIQDLMPCREVCESYTNNAVKAGCNIAKLLYVDCDQFPEQEMGNCTMASGPRTLNDAMKLGMNGALLLATLMVLAITIIL